MTQMPVTLKLPPALIEDLRLLAADRDETPGDMIRALLLREVARRRPVIALPPADPAPVERLTRRLSADIAQATSWADLALRLGRRGFGTRLAGGAPVLEDVSGQRLCALSDLGFSYPRLARRFGRPMPRRLRNVMVADGKRAAEVTPDGPRDLAVPT